MRDQETCSTTEEDGPLFFLFFLTADVFVQRSRQRQVQEATGGHRRPQENPGEPLEIAHPGDCKFWRLPIVEIANFGDCRFWRLQNLEIAIF